MPDYKALIVSTACKGPAVDPSSARHRTSIKESKDAKTKGSSSARLSRIRAAEQFLPPGSPFGPNGSYRAAGCLVY